MFETRTGMNIFNETARTMRVYVNVNQFSKHMATHTEEWAEGLENSDGLFATGASHPDDPMSPSDMTELMMKFGTKSKTHICTWSFLMGQKAGDWGIGNLAEWYRQKQLGFIRTAPGVAGPLPDVFAFDSSKSGLTLTTKQLDYLQQNGFQKVLINTQRWTDEGPGTEGIEDIQASINHAWCKGVVLEVKPLQLTIPKFEMNHQLQIAKYVQQIGKPLFILSTPTKPDADGVVRHINKLETMWNSLLSVIGPAFMSSDDFNIIAAAYNVTTSALPFLPEKLPNGEPADTYTGGLLWMTRAKKRLR